MTSKVFMIRLTADPEKIFALKIITNDYWNKRKDYIMNEIKVLKMYKGHPHIIELVDEGQASFLDTDNNEWG